MSSDLSKPEEFFICFGFEGNEDKLREFHVTHTYFGAIDECKLSDINNIIDDFFLKNFHQPSSVTFSNVRYFGADNSIRVLLPFYNTKIFYFTFLEELSPLLEEFNASEYPFSPHVTTNHNSVTGVINKLYLCGRSYRIIKEWAL